MMWAITWVVGRSRPLSFFGAMRLYVVCSDPGQDDLAASPEGSLEPVRAGAWSAWATRARRVTDDRPPSSVEPQEAWATSIECRLDSEAVPALQRIGPDAVQVRYLG